MIAFQTVTQLVDGFFTDNKTSTHSINFRGTETFQKLYKTCVFLFLKMKLNY